jgi:hypothetical protein
MWRFEGVIPRELSGLMLLLRALRMPHQSGFALLRRARARLHANKADISGKNVQAIGRGSSSLE